MCEPVGKTTRTIRNFYLRPVYKKGTSQAQDSQLGLWEEDTPEIKDILVIRWPGTVECVVWDYPADSAYVSLDPPAGLRGRLRGNGAPLLLRVDDWLKLQIEPSDHVDMEEAA